MIRSKEGKGIQKKDRRPIAGKEEDRENKAIIGALPTPPQTGFPVGGSGFSVKGKGHYINETNRPLSHSWPKLI